MHESREALGAGPAGISGPDRVPGGVGFVGMNMAPNYMHQYRESSSRGVQLNHAKKTCRGECGKSKSVGQFADGAAICIRCANRMPKKRSPDICGVQASDQNTIEGDRE